MKVQSIQSNSTNFKRLYMPAQKELVKYGKQFAMNAEKQRPTLEKLAQKADIYIVPRLKDQDLALAKEEFLDEFDEQFDFDLIDEIWPKGNYFNVHIFPVYARKVERPELRKGYSAMEIGVESDEITRVVRDIITEPVFAKGLDEKYKALQKVMKFSS